jgi:hypothetical protein
VGKAALTIVELLPCACFTTANAFQVHVLVAIAESGLSVFLMASSLTLLTLF